MNAQSYATAAPVTTLLLFINVALYVMAAMQGKNLGHIDPDTLFYMHSSAREILWEGDWLRLIAPNFLHANMLHIFMNMSTLLYFGPYQERIFGSSNFLSLYLLSGISGFCFSQIFGGTFSVGASGALFGLMGAELALYVLEVPDKRKIWRSRNVRVRVYLLAFFIGVGFAGSLLGRGSLGMLGAMDNWCHLGGAIAGFIFGILFESWRRRGRLNLVFVVLPLLVVGVLIAAARWTIFNPYYHVHMGAVALSEKRESDARDDFAEAQQWAERWGIQKRVALVADEIESGDVSLDDIRNRGYRSLDKEAARKLP